MLANRLLFGFFLAALLSTGSYQASAAPAEQPLFEDGEVLVKYRENRAAQRALHYRSMWRLIHSRTFARSGIRKVQLPDGMTVEQAVALYRADPDVLYAEPNYRYRLQAVPGDPDVGNLWGLINTGQRVNGTIGTADADMDADLAWDLETGSPDVIVAVVDSGIDPTHPDLAANLWTNPGEMLNGMDDDNNGYVDDLHGWDFADDDNQPNNPIDSHGHGTHVAGIIGAVGDNGAGIAGVNWQVRIMPLRFITAADYGTTADAIEAIEYADANGADVINLSWGGPGYSQALKDAIDATGALVVCAAGNEGNELDFTPTYPASYDSANILTVAASDADDHPAWFTNFSDNLADVAAPGTNVYSTVPDRQTLFSDDFSSLDDWTTGGTGDTWGIDALNMLSESPAFSYTNNMDAWVRLNPLNLSGRSGTRLDWWIIGTTAGTGDRLYLEASTDGSTWTPLWIGLDSGPVTAVSGTIATMQLAIADLKAYDGESSLHLRFRFVSDGAGTADGYRINDLAVTCADTTHGIDNYQFYQGTSMSAAYASGAAALIMARKPALTATEVRTRIETTVDDKPQLTGIVATGGRVNVYQALISMAAVELTSRASATRRIDLDWTALEPVDSGFEIQRRTASGDEYETIALVDATENAYRDSGLIDGTTYIYRVLTLSGAERTGYSNEAAATTPRSASSSASGGSGGGGGGGCFITDDDVGWGLPWMERLRFLILAGGSTILVLIIGIGVQRKREHPLVIDHKQG